MYSSCVGSAIKIFKEILRVKIAFQEAEYHGLSEPEEMLQLQWQNGGSRVCGHCWMTSILLPSTRWPHSAHAQTAFKSSLLQPGLHKSSFDFSATMLVANVEFMGVAWGLCDLLSSMFCCIESDRHPLSSQRHNCNENSLQKLITTHSFSASLLLHLPICC